MCPTRLCVCGLSSSHPSFRTDEMEERSDIDAHHLRLRLMISEFGLHMCECSGSSRSARNLHERTHGPSFSFQLMKLLIFPIIAGESR